MSFAHVYTVAFEGMEPREVDVQVHIGQGASTGGVFNVVGLADKAVGESRERVRAALNAVGLAFPYNRITVNLAPADLPKEGSHYDLPIALGLLAAMGVLPASEMAGYTAMGELSLDGRITAVAGVLPAAVAASAANRSLICPAACGSEAAWAGDVEIIAAPSLIALVNHIKGAQVLSAPEPKLAASTVSVPDLKDVKGQETAKRALEIAAALRNARRSTRRNCRGRSSTASIFTSRWQASRPPISRCRRPPKARATWPCAWQEHVTSSDRVSQVRVCVPTPKPRANCWTA